MGRLNKIKRNEIMSLLEQRYEQILSVLSSDDMCAKCSLTLTPYEIMMRKYRLAFCIKLLYSFGLVEKSIFQSLPDTEKLFFSYEKDEDTVFFNGWIEYPEDLIYELNILGEQYLSCCLENTSWKIEYIQNIPDYEQIDEAMLNEMKDVVNFHWGSMRSANEQFEAEVYQVESKVLEEKGFYAEDNIECIPECNIVLTNKKIETVLKLASIDNRLKRWKEYKELSRYRKFILFDRYYAVFDSLDISSDDWKYINYFLGEIFFAGREETGFYQLNYEAVLYLVLADKVAEDFLIRYETWQRIREGEYCGLQQ